MKKSRILCLVLALVMVFSLVACNNNSDNQNDNDNDNQGQSNPSNDNNTPSNDDNNDTPDGEPAAYADLDWAAIDQLSYDEQSEIIYDRALGEFNEYYQTAKAEIEDMDVRMALMALAEAKMMESGVFAPIYGDGGNYAMTRIVPRSGTTVSWGLDENSFYTYIVANELLTIADRTALVELWKAAPDEATWFTQAKQFLADKGYTQNDVYNASISYDMATWDVIATSQTSDSYFLGLTYLGLLEYDAKDIQQPAAAESYDYREEPGVIYVEDEDGNEVEQESTYAIYTFHIRQGIKWVDQQGREIADLTANDWVASMKHLLDNNGELGYLMSSTDGCGILNYDRFLAGKCTFEDVGVKALDDYTLEYTLEKKFTPFITMLGYGCFAPLNEAFYRAQGGTFGLVDGVEYTAGNYGTGPDTIAYCGAFLCTNYTPQNIWTYKANPSFLFADRMNIHEINWYYNDGSEVLRTYNDAKANTIAACAFNANALELAKTETTTTVDGTEGTYFDLYHYTTTNSATTYCAWLNLNRKAFSNFNDNTLGVSPQTEEDAARTRSAMNNQHFRLALAYAFDRAAYNAVSVGEELKYASLKNSYVSGTFLKLENDITIDINGTPTTFKAGTNYGEIEQAQLTADGYPIQVWDPEGDSGAGSGDGFDGWYNVDNAVAELNKAIEELGSVGIEISAENPIYIDAFYLTSSEINTNTKQAYKLGIESALGGKVIVNLVGYDTGVNMQYAYYRNPTGAEANFDISHNSGWGPDYGDPQTFLDTIQPYGYMCKNLGIY